MTASVASVASVAAVVRRAAGEVGAAALSSSIERSLADALVFPDEVGLDARWDAATVVLREYALRPGKRVRPGLLVAGYRLASGQAEVADGVLRFAAGLELLHTFMLVHDDVADRAETRRGGKAMHHLLGDGRRGEDLAVVVGDHLFARAFELMLTGGERSVEATQFMLAVSRHTAVGQYLDLELGTAALRETTLFQVLRVAHLKTARYGFVAPLVAGALLGGGSPELRESLERVGRHAGLAFQLRDDLIGLFGDERAAGKSTESDYLEGKRTFPLIAAFARADDAGRRELEALWAAPMRGTLDDARAAVERLGGRAATERVIHRATRTARKALAGVPAGAVRTQLDQLISGLERRST